MRNNLRNQWLSNVTEAHSNVYLVETAARPVSEDSSGRERFRARQTKCMLGHYLHTLKQRKSILPFGLAQVSRSQDINGAKEKDGEEKEFIYGSLDQTEMTLLFFAEPAEASRWQDFWRSLRLQWWNKFAKKAASFNALSKASIGNDRKDLDICYKFPWGEKSVESMYDHGQDPVGELEDKYGISFQGISRGSFTLPHLIEVHTTIERGLAAFLFDSSVGDLEDESIDVGLHLHPQLAPFHVAIVTRGGSEVSELREISSYLANHMHRLGISILDSYSVDGGVTLDMHRYDDIGVPWTVIVSEKTLHFGTLLLRNRDTGIKEIVSIAGLCERLSKYITSS